MNIFLHLFQNDFNKKKVLRKRIVEKIVDQIYCLANYFFIFLESSEMHLVASKIGEKLNNLGIYGDIHFVYFSKNVTYNIDHIS